MVDHVITASIILGLAAQIGAAQGRITTLVLGSDITEDLRIVSPTTVFDPDTPKVVCVWKAEGVTPGTRVRSVWIAEDTGGMAPPNFKIDEASSIASTSAKSFDKGGSFNLSRPTHGWPIGRYRVDIYLDQQLAKTARFTIQTKPGAPPPGPRILKAELGTDRSEDGQLENPGTRFAASTPQIVCGWISGYVKPGMAIRGVWIAEDTGGARPANFKINEATAIADASFERAGRSGKFTLHRPGTGWMPGRYRLEIYLGELLAQTVPFTIEAAPAAAAQAAARITQAELGTGRTEDWKVINPMKEFPAGTQRVVCVWRSQGLKPGTVVRDVWIAEDPAPGRPANRKVAEGSSARYTHGAFSLTSSSSKGLRAGRYRLEIYFGDDLAETVSFTVKAD